MSRPPCDCFHGAYPTCGDEVTSSIGKTLMRAYDEMLDACHVCPEAEEYVTAHMIVGLVGTLVGRRMLREGEDVRSPAGTLEMMRRDREMLVTLAHDIEAKISHIESLCREPH